ncbi:hypothetical protein M378DRAFT_369843 [Amanita muscaria Koide BX008]|uniref:Uncharacterized protein n=1 Tax=Amanita muscaria (strain Koide BX008) TaxID=946122 RepID=A0A0C2STB1_AMAMK|nr:hypothetical protein M378DRAFT_369843 [Amanita muscaria Koide BX008]
MAFFTNKTILLKLRVLKIHAPASVNPSSHGHTRVMLGETLKLQLHTFSRCSGRRHRTVEHRCSRYAFSRKGRASSRSDISIPIRSTIGVLSCFGG